LSERETLFSTKVSSFGVGHSVVYLHILVERDDGGHYAAAEYPYGMIEDIRALAAQQWQKCTAS
jgi:hypothetical protein